MISPFLRNRLAVDDLRDTMYTRLKLNVDIHTS